MKIELAQLFQNEKAERETKRYLSQVAKIKSK